MHRRLSSLYHLLHRMDNSRNNIRIKVEVRNQLLMDYQVSKKAEFKLKSFNLLENVR